MIKKEYVAGLLLCVSITACSLVEDLENKTYREQTIELLTQGGAWKVDSLVKWKFTPDAGVKDSLFLNYGTIEFQSPDNPKIPFGNNGYMIHRYTKNGTARVDTMAWEPFGAGKREPEPTPVPALTIWYEDPKGQATSFTDDLILAFDFRIKEQKKVNLAGEYSLTQSGIVVADYRYRYHLTR